jgi:DNA-binding NarL/FixJ family response regulator
MRIVIVVGHPLFREGVSQILGGATDIELLAHGATPRDAEQLAAELQPDILLLDLDLPDEPLLSAQVVAKRSPLTKIIGITVSEESEHVQAALRAGVRAYVLKGISGHDLIDVVRKVAAGESYVAPRLATATLVAMLRTDFGEEWAGALPSSDPLGGLTERERQILNLVAGGMRNKEVGQQLHLTEKTVKHHMSNILRRLHVRNRVEAALLVERSKHHSPPS